jgi:hypothetical protein
MLSLLGYLTLGWAVFAFGCALYIMLSAVCDE